MAREQFPTRSDATKYRKSRRKRQRARRMRRVEAVLPGGMTVQRPTLPGLPRLAGFSALSMATVRANVGAAAGSGWHWSKLISALLLAATIAGVYWLHWDLRWFVTAEAVEFDNLGYLNKADLYPEVEMELEDWSIFWVQPDVLREQVMAHPYVTDAAVKVALPNRVEVTIEEALPTALWVTREGTLWLLDDGAALTMRTRPGMGPESALLDMNGRDLPQIIDVNREAQAPGRAAIDAEVLHSALALLETFPELRDIRFNSGVGLNFALPGDSAYIYWGDGFDTERKLENLAAGRELMRRGDANGNIIDVRYVERPYIR